MATCALAPAFLPGPTSSMPRWTLRHLRGPNGTYTGRWRCFDADMRNGYGQLGLAQAIDLAAKAEADPLDPPADQELNLHVELVEVYRTVDSKRCDQDRDHPLNRPPRER